MSKFMWHNGFIIKKHKNTMYFNIILLKNLILILQNTKKPFGSKKMSKFMWHNGVLIKKHKITMYFNVILYKKHIKTLKNMFFVFGIKNE